MLDHKNIIVFLLIFALFLGATIEIQVGKYHVIFVIVVAVLLYVLDRWTK